MEYLKIETVNYGTINGTTENTSTTVGKLIKKLSQFDKDLPVVIKTGYDQYGGVGIVDKTETY